MDFSIYTQTDLLLLHYVLQLLLLIEGTPSHLLKGIVLGQDEIELNVEPYGSYSLRGNNKQFNRTTVVPMLIFSVLFVHSAALALRSSIICCLSFLAAL